MAVDVFAVMFIVTPKLDLSPNRVFLFLTEWVTSWERMH